jgi:hypothetical protein
VEDAEKPVNTSEWLLGTEYVDYTGLSSMYPWINKDGSTCYNDSSPYDWMWSPEKWKSTYNGAGYQQRIDSYKIWKAHEDAKAPSLKLDILNTDGTPYTYYYNNAYYRGQTIEGIARISNIGDHPFQGDVDVKINVSLYYAGEWYHMESSIMTVYVSVYTGQHNDFPVKYVLPSATTNGIIYDGAYGVTIELRDKSNGKIMDSLYVTPTIATMGDIGGSISITPTP